MVDVRSSHSPSDGKLSIEEADGEAIQPRQVVEDETVADSRPDLTKFALAKELIETRCGSKALRTLLWILATLQCDKFRTAATGFGV